MKSHKFQSKINNQTSLSYFCLKNSNNSRQNYDLFYKSSRHEFKDESHSKSQSNQKTRLPISIQTKSSSKKTLSKAIQQKQAQVNSQKHQLTKENKRQQKTTQFQKFYKSLRPTSRQLRLSDFKFQKLDTSYTLIQLPQEFQNLKKINALVDEKLQCESSKRCSFQELQQKASREGIHISLQHIQIINSLCPKFYSFYINQNKKIILEFQDSNYNYHIRSHTLAKKLVQLYQKGEYERLFENGLLRSRNQYICFQKSHSTNDINEQNIWWKIIKPLDIPQKKSKTDKNKYENKQEVRQGRPQQQFLQKVGDFIENKNKRYEQILEQIEQKEYQKQMNCQILKIIKKSFMSKSLNNLFKATIITILIKQYNIQEKQAIISIRKILKIKNSCLKAQYKHKSGYILQFNPDLYRRTLNKLKKLNKSSYDS